jgi:hypothetical protein
MNTPFGDLRVGFQASGDNDISPAIGELSQTKSAAEAAVFVIF